MTHHGPGQLVLYPILDLQHHRKDLHWYMRSLEEVAIRYVAVEQRFLGYWGLLPPALARSIRAPQLLSTATLLLDRDESSQLTACETSFCSEVEPYSVNVHRTA